MNECYIFLIWFLYLKFSFQLLAYILKKSSKIKQKKKKVDINYEYYKVFYYVAKHKSITNASYALYKEQPNVTRTIKKLEQALECTLFERTRNGITLTPEGEKLYERIKIA